MNASVSNSIAGAGMLTVRAALQDAIARLSAAEVPSHTLAAELLLMSVLQRDRAWLYGHPEFELDAAAAGKYFELIARRESGVPTQYLTGKQEFWGLEFEVTPDVLIPRPETEHVIEVALERLGPARKKEPLRIADVGTGSGCIAVALARELPNAEIIATDISAAALAVAQRNASRHSVASRVQFVETNLLDTIPPWRGHPARVDLPRAFDLVVSNPPYIPLGERTSLQREVRAHEPEIALFAGDDGLAVYAPLIRDAAALLRSGGILVLELGYNSLAGVRELFDRSGVLSDIRVAHDLAGIPRVISAALS